MTGTEKPPEVSRSGGTDDERGTLTRRALLTAASASVAATAGCSSLRDVFGMDTGSYDADALREIPTSDLRPEPSSFPLAIPERMIGRHRERAHDLIESVPKEPDIPNGAVARQIAAERAEVAGSLAEPDADANTGIERLWEWRDRRKEAARVAGAYRAATGNVSRTTVLDRSRQLRDRLLSFRRQWAYEADGIASALVFHEQLESLALRCQDELNGWPPFPADPADAVFEVGEVIEALEHADAIVGDLRRLRRQYVGSRDTTSYRYEIVAAANRMRELLFYRSDHNLGEYVRKEEDAFGRSLDGSPAQAAFQAAVDAVEFFDRGRGIPATKFLEMAAQLAAREALTGIVRRIRDGQFSPPQDENAVEDRYQGALAALETAWATEPRPLAVAVAAPAYETFRRAHTELKETDGDAEEVNDAVGWLVYAEQHAAAVPTAGDRAVRVLRT